MSKALNTYRHSIDTDIKLHGAEDIRIFKPTMANNPRQEQANTVMQIQRDSQSRPAIRQFNRRGTGTKSFTMRTNFVEQGSSNGTGSQDLFRNNSYRNQATKYCSLCGKKDHLATDGCPNMVSNSGELVPVLPTYGICQVCPDEVSPRLNHPATLCPYRKGGPFDKNQ